MSVGTLERIQPEHRPTVLVRVLVRVLVAVRVRDLLRVGTAVSSTTERPAFDRRSPLLAALCEYEHEHEHECGQGGDAFGIQVKARGSSA